MNQLKANDSSALTQRPATDAAGTDERLATAESSIMSLKRELESQRELYRGLEARVSRNEAQILTADNDINSLDERLTAEEQDIDALDFRTQAP
jgi:septal ring factor EnvC (AmiA/AmiB activator)